MVDAWVLRTKVHIPEISKQIFCKKGFGTDRTVAPVVDTPHSQEPDVSNAKRLRRSTGYLCESLSFVNPMTSTVATTEPSVLLARSREVASRDLRTAENLATLGLAQLQHPTADPGLVCELLTSRGEHRLLLGQFSESLEDLTRACDLAGMGSLPYLRARSLYARAVCMMDKYAEASSVIEEVLIACEASDSLATTEDYIRALIEAANISMYDGKYVKCIDYGLRGIDYCNMHGLTPSPRLVTTMGIAYLSIGEARAAYEVLHRSLPYLFDLPAQTCATVFANLGKSCVELGLYDEAIRHCRSALSMHRSGQHGPTILLTMAQAYNRSERFAEAVEAATEALSLSREGGFVLRECAALRELAKALVGLGQAERALPMLKESLEMTTKHQIQIELPSHIELLSCYAAMNDVAATVEQARLLVERSKLDPYVHEATRAQLLGHQGALARAKRNPKTTESELVVLGEVVRTAELLAVYSPILDIVDSALLGLRTLRQLHPRSDVEARLIENAEEYLTSEANVLDREDILDRLTEANPAFLNSLTARFGTLSRLEMLLCILVRAMVDSDSRRLYFAADPDELRDIELSVLRKLGLRYLSDIHGTLPALLAS